MGATLLLFQLSRLDLYALTGLEGFSNSVTLRAAVNSKRHLSLLTYVGVTSWMLKTLHFLLYSFIMTLSPA